MCLDIPFCLNIGRQNNDARSFFYSKIATKLALSQKDFCSKVCFKIWGLVSEALLVLSSHLFQIAYCLNAFASILLSIKLSAFYL